MNKVDIKNVKFSQESRISMSKVNADKVEAVDEMDESWVNPVSYSLTTVIRKLTEERKYSTRAHFDFLHNDNNLDFLCTNLCLFYYSWIFNFKLKLET